MGAIVSAAGLFALILGAFLTYAARKNGEATRALIRNTDEATRDLIQSINAATQALIRSTNAATQGLIRSINAETRDLIDRMDKRADERRREVIAAISALRAT